jgi:hypothetical protein
MGAVATTDDVCGHVGVVGVCVGADGVRHGVPLGVIGGW